MAMVGAKAIGAMAQAVRAAAQAVGATAQAVAIGVAIVEMMVVEVIGATALEAVDRHGGRVATKMTKMMRWQMAHTHGGLLDVTAVQVLKKEHGGTSETVWLQHWGS